MQREFQTQLICMSSDSHKTPYKFMCSDNCEHEMKDEGKDWNAEVEIILTHIYSQ